MHIDDRELGMGWNFDNIYIHLPKKLYTRQGPIPVPLPKLVVFNKPLAEFLGLNVNVLQEDSGVAILAGNKIPKGSISIAQAYAGHQFGYFTMLGDGRALLLGEQITPKGERFDIQLKGSGRTAYSRGGDGRAALGPMLREYIISEALHGLGIPTSRSLGVVTTGETIEREETLPGAILTRVASSHIRVGTFQYISAYGNVEELRQLVEYTLQRHFSDITSGEDRYLSLLREVIKRQARLIARWQLVGFIHGVMNTDNMAISGEAIDFGPCAFMDTYDPKTVFSSIDRNGRYAYENQPPIAAWNLARFAETLLPLLHDDEDRAIEIANEEIADFHDIYRKLWLDGMRGKLGIFGREPEDESIIHGLLDIMQAYDVDFTNTFRALTMGKLCGTEFFDSKDFVKWKDGWKTRLNKQRRPKEESEQLMRGNNPAIIPRNHRVEEVLEAAEKQNDYEPMHRFVRALSDPYAYSVGQEEYTELPSPSKIPYRTFCGT